MFIKASNIFRHHGSEILLGIALACDIAAPIASVLAERYFQKHKDEKMKWFQFLSPIIIAGFGCSATICMYNKDQKDITALAETCALATIAHDVFNESKSIEKDDVKRVKSGEEVLFHDCYRECDGDDGYFQATEKEFWKAYAILNEEYWEHGCASVQDFYEYFEHPISKKIPYMDWDAGDEMWQHNGFVKIYYVPITLDDGMQIYDIVYEYPPLPPDEHSIIQFI